MNATHPPRTNAEEIGRRVLDWIVGIHGPEDLSRDRLETAIGLPMIDAPGDPGRYGIGERIDERWHYSLHSLPDDGERRRMLFSFDDSTGAFDDLSAICALDYDAYAAALTAAGYAQAPDLGPREAFNGMIFTRDGVRVRMQLLSESAARPGHLCVSALLIDAAGGGHAQV